ERPHLDPRLLLGAHLDGAHRTGQIRHTALVNPLAAVHATGRGAVVAGGVEAERPYPRDERLDVGVLEHHDRRLAPELQVRPFERLGGRRPDLLPGGDGAGERHPAYARMTAA